MIFKKYAKEASRLIKLHVLRDNFTIEHNRYVRDGGENLRFNYPELSSSSVVFDIGGFKGDFTEKIHEKYGCNVFLFEPDPTFFSECERRFASNENIAVFNYGLSDEDGSFWLSAKGDGSSFHNPKHRLQGGVRCEVRNVEKVLEELDIGHIHLMKINIEGGEFPLLRQIVESGKIASVDQIQVQFHDFVKDADLLKRELEVQLSETHVQTWCYQFIWENWRRKGST